MYLLEQISCMGLATYQYQCDSQILDAAACVFSTVLSQLSSQDLSNILVCCGIFTAVSDCIFMSSTTTF